MALVTLVTCPCAFRLRGLAQNDVPGRGVWRFPWKISIQTDSCEMSMCIWTAQAQTKCWPRESRPALPLSISTQNVSCEMSMCISTAQARTKRDISYRNLAKRRLIGSLYRDPAKRRLWRSCSKILPRDLLQRSCQQSSKRDLVQRSCHETSCRDLVQRPAEESSDLSQKSCLRAWKEILLWGLSQRSSVAISYREISFRVLPRDLLKRSCAEIFPGHLWGSCTETLHRDLLQGSCQEVFHIHLAKGVFREFVQRSRKEILPRDLV